MLISCSAACAVCKDLRINRDKYFDQEELSQYLGGSCSELSALLREKELGYYIDGVVYVPKKDVRKMGFNEASEYLKISKDSLADLVNKGQIPYCYLDCSLFFLKPELDDWKDDMSGSVKPSANAEQAAKAKSTGTSLPEHGQDALIERERRKYELLCLRASGMSNYDIAKQYGVSEGAVRKWLK